MNHMKQVFIVYLMSQLWRKTHKSMRIDYDKLDGKINRFNICDRFLMSSFLS